MESKPENLFDIPVQTLQSEVSRRNFVQKIGYATTNLGIVAGVVEITLGGLAGGMPLEPVITSTGVITILGTCVAFGAMGIVNQRRLEQLKSTLEIQKKGFQLKLPI